MLKLYIVPGVCSLASHIALRESGLPFQVDRIDLKNNKRTESGENYTELNPKGYVPALRMENGEVLTEGAVILQFIGDAKPESRLTPAPGTVERLRLQEWLHFIATELHKGLSPLYAPKANEEYKQAVKERFAMRLVFLEKALQGKNFLLGNTFTVADCYAYYVLRAWTMSWKGALPENVASYFHRLSERPSVRAALTAEGLS